MSIQIFTGEYVREGIGWVQAERRKMNRQFDSLTASELHCPKCGGLRPVRERLLLVLPGAKLHEYKCSVCGESLGTREVKERPENAGKLIV